MKRKLISMMLCAVMAISVFAGCGKKADTSEQVELTWVVNRAQQADADKVEALINEELAKLLPNTTLDIVWEPSVDTKFSLWMAGDTAYDLVYRGYTTDMQAEQREGFYMPLNDLVKEYGPNIQKQKEEWVTAYNSASVDDELYAIPNEQPILHQSSWISVDAKFVDYFPMDEWLKESQANRKSTEKMYQMYDEYLGKLVSAGLVTPGQCSIDVINFFNAMATRGYDWVGTAKDGAWLCYDAYDENAEIVSFFETDTYKLFIKYSAMWFEKGYISEDYMATGNVTGANIGVGNTQGCWYGIDEERGVQYVKDGEGNITEYRVFMDPEDTNFLGTDRFGSEMTYTVIPYTSENPERAMMLLDLLYSEEGKDLLNLIIYGEEGTHYTAEESADGDIVAYGNGYTDQPSSANDYGIPHWMVANVFECYRTPNILDGQKEWAEKIIKNRDEMYHTRFFDIRFDTSEVDYEIQQISLIVKEYHEQLICGGLKTSGYEKTYSEFISKMKTAGLEDVLKKLNQQAEEALK